jgi:heme-degrading monooxygenase HmoA
MSVIMGLRLSVDPDRFERVVKSDPGRLLEIAQRARQRGATRHRFLANEDGGEVLVIDEWPDAASFYAFFEDSEDVDQMMAEAGVTDWPRPTFWRELDTPDRF